jgi:hypothetical protein
MHRISLAAILSLLAVDLALAMGAGGGGGGGAGAGSGAGGAGNGAPIVVKPSVVTPAAKAKGPQVVQSRPRSLERPGRE